MTSRARLAGVGLVFFCGLIAAAIGAWFVVGSHPFDESAGAYSDEVGLTRDQALAASPTLYTWLLHVSDQTGSVSFGWGMFVMALAVTGLRQGVGWARNVLWLAAMPTLAFSAFGEWIQFHTVDPGTVSSIAALVLFVAGMGLTYVPAPAPEPDVVTA